MTKLIYKPQEFADVVGVSTRTLVRWDEDGKFKARRNPSGNKFYTQEDLDNYLGGKYTNVLSEAECLQVFLESSMEDAECGRTISSETFKNKLKQRKEDAMKDLKVSENIELSKEDAIAFIEALEAPAKVNEKMLKAAARYKEVMSETEYLLESENNASRLKESIAQIK